MLEVPVSVSAGRTGLFPIGPTAPYSFTPGSPERAATEAALKEIRARDSDITSHVGGKELRTGNTTPITAPHNHKQVLGQLDFAGATETQAAIEASLESGRWWSALPWEERVAPFLRAADMLEYGP